MVLFQFIPNSGIFGGFQLLGSLQFSKCTISTFSAEINNGKSCSHMRFSSSKYTKLHLWPGRPHCGSLHALRPPSSWWEGARCPSRKPHCRSWPYGPSVFGPWPQRSCASLLTIFTIVCQKSLLLQSHSTILAPER